MGLGTFIERIFFSGPWIINEPPENDDEKIFGTLASDIGRKTGAFPGFVKYELDKMIALGNPLATKFNNLALGAGYSTFDSEFHDLCHVVTQRLQIASSQPK